MAYTIKSRVQGVEQAVKALDELRRAVRNRIMKKALRKGARIIVTAARGLVPKGTRELSKSLGIVMRTYKNSGVVVAIIGPRTGRKTTQSDSRGRSYANDPANYAHLVEGGRKAVEAGTRSKLTGPRGSKRASATATGKKVLYGHGRFWGPKVRPAAPRPFLHQATADTQSRVRDVVNSTIADELAKEAVKAAGGKPIPRAA